jgi:hypothetical protein
MLVGDLAAARHDYVKAGQSTIVDVLLEVGVEAL